MYGVGGVYDLQMFIQSVKMNKKKLRPTCLACGKKMKPVKDFIAGKITGYLWSCKCMPGIILSIG